MNDCAVQQIVLYINDYCSVALRSRPFHSPETKGKQILMSLRPMKHIGLGSASSKSMILADQKYDSQDPRQCANTMRQYNAASLLSRSLWKPGGSKTIRWHEPRPQPRFAQGTSPLHSSATNLRTASARNL